MDHHRAGHPSRVSRTHPSAPLTSPAARRRRNPNPSPPSWGGGGPQPAGGRRPQAARHQTPVARAASCRLARALGRVRGRGAFGPPSGGRDQPKENHGRAPDRGPPPPRRRAAGGGPAGGGRIRRRRGTGAGKAANPTPRRPQPATGPPPPRQSAPAGGLRPPAPRRPATRPDAGRPQAGRPAASHQPTPTAARAPGPGPDKAGPLRWGGGGRAGPVPARPAPDRPHTLAAQPATFGGGLATATGAAPAAGRFAPETAGGPRGPGAAAYGHGLTERGASDPVPGGGEVRIEAGAVPPGRGAASAAKKMAGGLSPRLDTTGRKKCGEDALSPPLAVTADTRYPPVRRSSPKRTRCRPVPCALAMRRLPRPPSCLP